MKSTGVIETRGLTAAIQAADAACKAADVICTGYRKPGSGLVSVCFEGNISAMHAAIEHGKAAAGAEQIVSSLIVARPERCVIEALVALKGCPQQIADKSGTFFREKAGPADVENVVAATPIQTAFAKPVNASDREVVKTLLAEPEQTTAAEAVKTEPVKPLKNASAKITATKALPAAKDKSASGKRKKP